MENFKRTMQALSTAQLWALEPRDPELIRDIEKQLAKAAIAFGAQLEAQTTLPYSHDLIPLIEGLYEYSDDRVKALLCWWCWNDRNGLWVDDLAVNIGFVGFPEGSNVTLWDDLANFTNRYLANC